MYVFKSFLFWFTILKIVPKIVASLWLLELFAFFLNKKEESEKFFLFSFTILQELFIKKQSLTVDSSQGSLWLRFDYQNNWKAIQNLRVLGIWGLSWWSPSLWMLY